MSSTGIIKNTLYNLYGRIWAMVVGVALTPYILGHIGDARYGIWALVGVMTGYFGLIDLGIGTAFVKYIAEFKARKEFEKINQFLNTSFLAYCVIGALILGVFLMAAKYVMGLLKIPQELSGEAMFVFCVGMALFCASNIIVPFSSLQAGYKRFDISNKIAIGLSFFNIIGTILFLENGFGLVGLMINNVIIFVMSAVVNMVVACRLFPEFRFSLRFFSRDILSKLVAFGSRMQVAKIATIVTVQTDKILISAFLALSLVTIYQLGAYIVESTAAVVIILAVALIPAFSEIAALGERDKLLDLYLRSTRYMALFVVPFFFFVLISAHHIISGWMGDNYGRAAMIARVLVLNYMVNIVAQAGAAVSIAINKPQFMARGSIITIVANIILCVTLIKLFGFMGVAWGATIAGLVGTLYFVVQVHREFGIPFKRFTESISPFFGVCCLSSLVLIPADVVLGHLGFFTSRFSHIVFLFAEFAVFLVLYILGLQHLEIKRTGELDALKNKILHAVGLKLAHQR